MKYTYLGKTGVQISCLSFGTMTFGGEADENTSSELYARCRDVGINFFDSANVYNEGKAEALLGRLIQHERESVLISTKAYFPTGKDVNAKGLSRRHIVQEVEKSLKRLNTDYIDIYFLHHFDEHSDLEETLRALNDLVAQAKILYIGVSNFAAWQIMKACGICALKNFPPISVMQPMYNLLKRQAEVELFPMAVAEKLAVIPYNPLAGGLLSGKYASLPEKPDARLLEKEIYKDRYLSSSNTEITNRFVAFAKEKGYSPVSLAIAWAHSHPAVTSLLLGARNAHQLNECLQGVDIEMTEDLRQEISLLSPEPPLATDRSEERSTK